MILLAGWENGKFVLMVTNTSGDVLHRISMTEDEFNRVDEAMSMQREGVTVLINADHKQVG